MVDQGRTTLVRAERERETTSAGWRRRGKAGSERVMARVEGSRRAEVVCVRGCNGAVQMAGIEGRSGCEGRGFAWFTVEASRDGLRWGRGRCRRRFGLVSVGWWNWVSFSAAQQALPIHQQYSSSTNYMQLQRCSRCRWKGTTHYLLRCSLLGQTEKEKKKKMRTLVERVRCPRRCLFHFVLF